MILATSHMSESAQAVFYLFAVILFICAAVLAYVSKAVWATFVAGGLALAYFVLMWNAFAAS